MGNLWGAKARVPKSLKVPLTQGVVVVGEL